MVGVWLFILSWASLAHAAAEPTLPFSQCKAVTAAAAITPIKRVDRPNVPGEIERFGTITTGRLPSFGEGTHVYLIVRLKGGEQVLVHSRGAPFDEFIEAGWVVTHRSLEKLLPEGAEVLAAGEIRVVDGKVNEVNNGASTYPAGRESLEFAAGWLKGRGLAVEPTTTLRDYSVRGGRDHDVASNIAKVATAYRTYSFSPHILAVQEIRKILGTKFAPKEGPPGEDLIGEYNLPRGWSDQKLNVYSKLTTLLKSSEVEGIEYALEVVGGKRLMPLVEKNDTRAISEYSKDLMKTLIEIKVLAKEIAGSK